MYCSATAYLLDAGAPPLVESHLLHASRLEVRQVLLAREAGVHRDLARRLSRIGLDLLQRGHRQRAVGRISTQDLGLQHHAPMSKGQTHLVSVHHLIPLAQKAGVRLEE